MNLFLKDLNDLTFQDIVDFCEQNFPESLRLDYKRELSSADPREQVIKGLSAFANTQGGLLLYGVGTKGSSKYPDWPSDGMALEPDFEKKVTRWCIEHISPPVVPFIKWIDNPNVQGKGFGVVRTEMSWHAPHTMEGGTKIFVRRADNSDPLPATLAEIELLRNMRERALRREEVLWLDMRRRLEVRDNEVGSWIGFLLFPQFGREDAISMERLPEIARTLRDRGVRWDLIDRLTSYCDGVLSNEIPNWRLVLTSRGALGIGCLDSRAAEKTMDIDALVGWALLASRSARLITEEAGHWGRLRLSFEAYGYEGVDVIDSCSSIFTYRPCRDNRIVIDMAIEASEVRAESLVVGQRLFRRMLWAYGQHDRMWTDDGIMRRLVKKKMMT